MFHHYNGYGLVGNDNVAAIVHTTDGHAYATYELAGPERLDFVAYFAWPGQNRRAPGPESFAW